jgi:LAS superfamily LD-carboxypeptidase LdcB
VDKWIQEVIKFIRGLFHMNNDLSDIDISVLDIAEIAKIKLLHPRIQTDAYRLAVEAKQAGLVGGVFQTYRSFEEQGSLYSKGRDADGNVVDKAQIVTNTKPGYSWHQWGLALDWVFKNPKGWTWESTQWAELGAIGRKYFDWGGDWANFGDKPHFEKTFNLNRDKLIEVYKQNGNKLEAVWKYIDGIIEG